MNSMVYLYNGSFISLLTVINYLLKNNITPYLIKEQDNYEENLLDKTFYMNANDELANELVGKIIKCMPYTSLHHIYYSYLSGEDNKELAIYYYIKNGFKYSYHINELRNLKCVNKVLSMSKYVGSEAHKLKGFVRFREIDKGFLYAEVAPNNNCISILANHFVSRLKCENFVIKDVNRNIICVHENNSDSYKLYDGREYKITNLMISVQENMYQELWKHFFKTIAIKERENKKCQMNFMPKRYWKYILEMNDYE